MKINIIENFLGEEFNISNNDVDVDIENWKKYGEKGLIFRNCPNLKTINADCLNLKGLRIDNCPQLEHLSAYHNDISYIDLSNLTNLKVVNLNYNKIKEIDLESCESLDQLHVSENHLKELDLDDCLNLRILYCSYNLLWELEVNHLEKLETLHCESCKLEELNCNGLKKLKYLCCFNNGYCLERKEVIRDGVKVNVQEIVNLRNLHVDGCESLEILDCAENGIETFSLNNKPKLEIFSCKTNKLLTLMINTCPELKHLDFSMQGEREKRKEGVFFKNSIATDLLIDNCSNLERILHAERAEIFVVRGDDFVPFGWKDFPKLDSFGPGTADDPAFEEYINKKRQEEWERDNLNQPDEGYNSDSDLPSQEQPIFNVCNYKIPAKKNEIDHHDLSQRRLKGKLIIEDWLNLVSLNVGDNRLTALVVINCPKLKRLIYAHNAMPNEAEIYGCDIAEIDNYKYDEFVGKEETPISEEERAYIEEQERRERQREESEEESEDDKINHDITLEYLESLTYEELANLDPKSVPQYLARNVISLLTKKFKEQIKQQEQENKREKEALQKVAGLIIEAQQFLKEGNLPELARVLKEMEKHCDTGAYADNKLVITGLKERLSKLTSDQTFISPDKPVINYHVIVILLVSGVLTLIFLIFLAKFLQIKIKKMVKFK